MTKNQKKKANAKARKEKFLRDVAEGRIVLTPKTAGNEGENKKRNRSDSSSPLVTQSSKRPKEGRGGQVSGKVSYASVTRGSLQVAIVDSRYPEVPITEEQVDFIEEAITYLVMNQALETPIPHFDGRSVVNGTLMVTCSDVFGREWLGRNVGLLRPPGGATLKVIRPEELSRRALVRIYVMSHKAPRDILNIIGRFNPGLKPDSWIIKEHSNETGGADSLLLVSVPASEERALEELNLRPHFGLGKAKAKIVEPSVRKEKRLTESAPATVAGEMTETGPTVGVSPGSQADSVQPNESHILNETRKLGLPTDTDMEVA